MRPAVSPRPRQTTTVRQLSWPEPKLCFQTVTPCDQLRHTTADVFSQSTQVRVARLVHPHPRQSGPPVSPNIEIVIPADAIQETITAEYIVPVRETHAPAAPTVSVAAPFIVQRKQWAKEQDDDDEQEDALADRRAGIIHSAVEPRPGTPIVVATRHGGTMRGVLVSASWLSKGMTNSSNSRSNHHHPDSDTPLFQGNKHAWVSLAVNRPGSMTPLVVQIRDYEWIASEAPAQHVVTAIELGRTLAGGVNGTSSPGNGNAYCDDGNSCHGFGHMHNDDTADTYDRYSSTLCIASLGRALAQHNGDTRIDTTRLAKGAVCAASYLRTGLSWKPVYIVNIQSRTWTISSVVMQAIVENATDKPMRFARLRLMGSGAEQPQQRWEPHSRAAMTESMLAAPMATRPQAILPSQPLHTAADATVYFDLPLQPAHEVNNGRGTDDDPVRDGMVLTPGATVVSAGAASNFAMEQWMAGWRVYFVDATLGSGFGNGQASTVLGSTPPTGYRLLSSSGFVPAGTVSIYHEDAGFAFGGTAEMPAAPAGMPVDLHTGHATDLLVDVVSLDRPRTGRHVQLANTAATATGADKRTARGMGRRRLVPLVMQQISLSGAADDDVNSDDDRGDHDDDDDENDGYGGHGKRDDGLGARDVLLDVNVRLGRTVKPVDRVFIVTYQFDSYATGAVLTRAQPRPALVTAGRAEWHFFLPAQQTGSRLADALSLFDADSNTTGGKIDTFTKHITLHIDRPRQ